MCNLPEAPPGVLGCGARLMIITDRLPRRLSDMGEKRIIREILRPLLNPASDINSIGDDCAVIPVCPGKAVCVSTDRVPADLVSFRLGIIDYRGLGNYLAVLNLSDLAAMGATPSGLLLNLGLPPECLTADFTALVEGAREACTAVGCSVLGGDLSSASELSISATSLGLVESSGVLRRSGARPGDVVYCSDTMGLAATAFAYLLEAAPKGFVLPPQDEELLKDCFRRPRPRFDVGAALRGSGRRATAMDNTDGAAQTFSEIAEAGDVGVVLQREQLPIAEVSWKVAAFLNMDVVDLVLGPGADFQLLGTIEPAGMAMDSLRALIEPVGVAISEPGLFLEADGSRTGLNVRGWNYYSAIETAHSQSHHPGDE